MIWQHAKSLKEGIMLQVTCLICSITLFMYYMRRRMNISLVIDLFSKKGNKGVTYGSLILEHSPIHTYWVRAIEKYIHG